MLPPVPLLARLLLGLFSLVAPSLGFYAWFVEPSTVVVSRHDLEVPGLAPVTRERPLRILHLSDLQTSYLGSRELKVNELGQELEPDLILFSGDLTTRTLWGDAPERSADAVLSRLSAPFGFFGIAGDSETPEKAKEILERNEHVLLRNERRTLNIRGQTVVIIGLDRASPDFSLLDEKVPEGALSILLAHSPDVVLDLGWDPETSTLRRPATAPPLPHLILTGHTHGGQIVLPFVGAPVTLTRLGRRYASGLFDLKGPLLHVSRGLGMEGHFAPRIRFLCPPEVTLFTVRAAAGKSVAEEETVFTRPGG
jgi:hypothetical protein